MFNDETDIITHEEWKEQLEEVRDNPNVTYRTVWKLAETLSPTNVKKKSSRVDFFEKEPKWFDSVTRRLKRLAQKRARSDEEEEQDAEGEDEVEIVEQPARKKNRINENGERNGLDREHPHVSATIRTNDTVRYTVGTEDETGEETADVVEIQTSLTGEGAITLSTDVTNANGRATNTESAESVGKSVFIFHRIEPPNEHKESTERAKATRHLYRKPLT